MTMQEWILHSSTLVGTIPSSVTHQLDATSHPAGLARRVAVISVGQSLTDNREPRTDNRERSEPYLLSHHSRSSSYASSSVYGP